jgi:hypothetical protein
MIKLKYLLFALLIIIPSEILSQSRNDPEFTAKFFIKAMDYKSPAIKYAAEDIIKKHPDNYIYRLCETFDLIYLNWKYRDHTGKGVPYVRASKSISNFTGDCKDYASTMVSMFIALGSDGRLVCTSTHVYPEVYLGKDLSQNAIDSVLISINNYYEAKKGYSSYTDKIHYHTDKDGSVWLNMDWQENYPGARFIENESDDELLIIFSNGIFKEEFLVHQIVKY